MQSHMKQAVGRYEGTDRFLGRRKQPAWFLHSSWTWRANLNKCLVQPYWGTSMGNHVRTRCRWPTMLESRRRKEMQKKPLRGYFCPLTAYSTEFCHPVRRKVATQSMAKLPRNPQESCHPVHGISATRCTAALPLSERSDAGVVYD